MSLREGRNRREKSSTVTGRCPLVVSWWYPEGRAYGKDFGRRADIQFVAGNGSQVFDMRDMSPRPVKICQFREVGASR
jgi:hypothetical protein